jgi:tetrahydromethanopterin S-methyltransferase subunit B
MKNYLLIVIIAFFSLNGGLSAQEEGSLNSGTISSQFDYLNSVSNNYQEFKVVKKANLDRLRKNVTDSLNVFKDELASINIDLKQNQEQITKLETQISEVQEELQKAEEARDSFSFLGIPIHKSAYSSLMWTIVLGLLGAFLFFLYQYSQSHKVISKARKDLEETREEFDQHRKNTLERERKLKRELVDALNQKTI